MGKFGPLFSESIKLWFIRWKKIGSFGPLFNRNVELVYHVEDGEVQSTI